MIKVSNFIEHRNLSFNEYKELNGISFSYLKGPIEVISEGMRLGKSVHQYLLSPAEYDYKSDYADAVKEIAKHFKPFLSEQMISEVPITAEFQSAEDFTILYKGIPDLRIPRNLIVDLKILSGSLSNAIVRFNYKEQIRGYMIASNCPRGVIIAYNKAKKRVEMEIVTREDKWWYNIINQYGKPCSQIKMQ